MVTKLELKTWLLMAGSSLFFVAGATGIVSGVDPAIFSGFGWIESVPGWIIAGSGLVSCICLLLAGTIHLLTPTLRGVYDLEDD